jgi:16S rRNA (cytosine967-C5)-methyltransferase
MALLKLVSEQKPRQIAAQVLQQRRARGEFIEDLLQTALARAALSPADRGLCQEIVYGVVRWQAALDWLIARKTDRREQKPALQDLLRLGLYQIFWLDRIPDHAAVHETVELARQNGFGTQAGFVNAILRSYLREHDATKKLLAGLKISQPALGWSHPEWLVARWQKRWGAEKTAQLLNWNNTPPKTFARVNTLKFGGTDGARLWSKTQPQHAGHTGDTGKAQAAAAGAPHTAAPQKMADAGDLLTRWRAENVEYDFVRRDWLEENLVFELKSHPPLPALASFLDGWFYVQDPGTLLAPALLGAQPGETVLDFCAAPGGKTTFIAQRMNNQGLIVAQDVSEERLKLVRENCTRLGVTIVETCRSQGDKAQTSKAGMDQRLLTSSPTNEKFDRVLVDAPCSNTGVMRRRVDLRWRIQPKEIERLRAAQLDLLKQAASRVKPGGILVYSTCSLEPEENQEVVKQFLSECAGFKLDSERELLPFVDNVDGAFVTRFVKS